MGFRSPTPPRFPEQPRRIDPPKRMDQDTLAAWGVTPADQIKGDVDEARRLLMDALKTADHFGETDLHRRIGFQVLAMDDLLAVISERTRS